VTPRPKRQEQTKKPQVPQFEMRHRMLLALEYSGVSVNEMAAELELSRTTISNYLHGRTRPRRGELIQWALKTGLPFEWLVSGEDIANGKAKATR
jgi:transcriptional regulator with XRE-family HTH domain